MCSRSKRVRTLRKKRSCRPGNFAGTDEVMGSSSGASRCQGGILRCRSRDNHAAVLGLHWQMRGATSHQVIAALDENPAIE